MKNDNLNYMSTFSPPNSIGEETITIYGAGINKDSTLVLNKTYAAFLLIDLMKFLKIEK